MLNSALEESISYLYRNLRLVHYRNLFCQVKEKAGSLSATEAFSAEVIYLLGQPTIGEFAAFIGISQPNASYKVNALVTKGYLERVSSDDDRREAHLNVTKKFLDYYGRQMPDVKDAVSAAARHVHGGGSRAYAKALWQAQPLPRRQGVKKRQSPRGNNATLGGSRSHGPV